MDTKKIVDQLLEAEIGIAPGLEFSKPEDSKMRRFVLVRDEDVHNKSGEGIVAEGVEFSDGTVAMRWLTKTASTTIFKNVAELEKIHGHEGKSNVRWID